MWRHAEPSALPLVDVQIDVPIEVVVADRDRETRAQCARCNPSAPFFGAIDEDVALAHEQDVARLAR